MDYLKLSSQLKKEISQWLFNLELNLENGHIRFILKDNRAPIKGKSGQFLMCYYMKIAKSIGLWNGFSKNKKDDSVNFIKSFQSKNGFFYDYKMLAKMSLGSTISMLPKGQIKRWVNHIPQCIRAETRQSASSLLMVDEKPNFLLPIPFKNISETLNFIDSLDWDYPWSAGSHASHIILFNYINIKISNVNIKESNINPLLEKLDSYQDANNGTWSGKTDVNPAILINGAMKILTIYDWTGKNLNHSEKIIDFALSQPFQQSGCNFLNRLYVLYITSRYTEEYRKEDIISLAKRSIQEVLKYKKEDGGFSFTMNSAQKRYYRAKVSCGGKYSDLHGTVMFSWALAICFQILEIDNGWSVVKP